MSQATAYEQMMLELVNAERAKTGAQPLVFNSNLNDAADAHDSWMIATDTFSHTGASGSSPTQRMTDAGYGFTGTWASAENIAWASTRAPAGYQDEVELLHTNLMNSAGHRANMLNGSLKEIGIGFSTGEYQGWDGAFVTEDFALSGDKTFLTGVALNDGDGDRLYDIGEGVGGLTVTAVGTTGASYTTTTQVAGGYTLALNPGTYTVTFSGSGVTPVTKQVTIGTQNVKVDLLNPGTVTTVTAGTNSISGNSRSNTLSGTPGDDRIKGYGGNDKLYAEAGDDKLYGGVGNDRLMGDEGTDRLYGSSGKDVLNGGLGDDILNGGADADTFQFRSLWGADRIYGFQDRVDHIDLRNNDLHFRDLSITKIDADQDGRADDVLITAHDQTITLLNLKASLLSAKDFLF